jgi:hypothetical protein
MFIKFKRFYTQFNYLFILILTLFYIYLSLSNFGSIFLVDNLLFHELK